MISAEACLHPWLELWVSGRQGIWLFEEHNLFALEEELGNHGQTLWQIHHMYLPRTEIPTPQIDFAVRWYGQEEILSLPDKESFPNALALEPACLDMLAVAAVENDKIIGLACCSADTPEWWQIGIDVLTGHRSAGIGSKLVLLLKNEILRGGPFPFTAAVPPTSPPSALPPPAAFSPPGSKSYRFPKTKKELFSHD